MVTLVKHEWHSVDSQFAIELDEALLSEIYTDLDETEIENLMKRIEIGEVSVEEIVEAAWENDVELEWDRQYDDWWTERKGGYDVTYELGDESSWVTPDTPPEPTHKCTNCKWTGRSYEGDWVWEDKDGNELKEAKQVCPYCESDLELTEHGKVEEEASKKRMAELDVMFSDDEEPIPCFSCNTPYKESELEYLGGQYICPNCGEGWVMLEDRPKE
jgi:Zn finger protein HypA/HybF involved in hydrogenase expression